MLMKGTEPKAALLAAPSPTEQKLFDRLQRRLRAQGLQLRRCREDSRDFHDLGRFYVVDASLNCVHSIHVDLAGWLAGWLSSRPKQPKRWANDSHP